jgi:hypothetical protein
MGDALRLEISDLMSKALFAMTAVEALLVVKPA